MVVAPGGGWIANPGCLELLRPPARMIYLKARPAILAARMGGSVSDRPLLLRANPVTELITAPGGPGAPVSAIRPYG